MTDATHTRLAALSGTRAYADLPHKCRCQARWSGGDTCHCGSCHLTFTGLDAFTRHRKGGTCANPATIGMTLAPGRAYEAWSALGMTTEADDAEAAA